MREFQERRRVKKLLHSRYIIAILAIVCLLLGHAVWGVYGKYKKSKDIADKMQSDLSALEARQSALSQSIDSLGTPEGREREMRDRFAVAKEGEKVVVLVDANGTDSQSQIPAQKSLWVRFIGMFGF